MNSCRSHTMLVSLLVFVCAGAVAEPFLAPGNLQLRSDLQLLNDGGITNIPLTAWPVSAGDVHDALAAVERRQFDGPIAWAVERVRRKLDSELSIGEWTHSFAASGSVESRFIRTFENTPRDEGEISASIGWVGGTRDVEPRGDGGCQSFRWRRLST